MAIWNIYCIFVIVRAKNEYLSDQEIVEGLIAQDNYITSVFFWEKCSGIFSHIIHSLYDLHPQKELLKEELIQRLYSYLMDHDARVLRGFEYRSSLLTWLRQVAYRFFERQLSNERKAKKAEDIMASLFDDVLCIDDGTEETRSTVRRVLDAMPNQELACILRRKYLDDFSFESLAAELDKTTAHIYVLKQRAVKMFIETYYKLES